jgi:RimJ/RimL family protein N-acetyltransferase
MIFYRPNFLKHGERLAAPYRPAGILTNRLVLRPYTNIDSNRSAWAEITSDPTIREGLGWPERNRAQSDRHLKDRTHHNELRVENDFLALGVFNKATNELVGDVSAHLRLRWDGEWYVELGWLLRPGYTGQGYAAEAASALLFNLSVDTGIERFLAVIHPNNTASRAVAERLGMQYAGTDVDAISADGWCAVHYMKFPSMTEGVSPM